ncbi:hypothetical protein AAHC03_09359 [Spirometra sp. Aus1]
MPKPTDTREENDKGHEIDESKLDAGPCPICGRLMASRHGMKRHVKIVHKGAGECKCGACNRKFTTSFALQRHLKRVHQGFTEEEQTCPFCCKQFCNKHSLDRHLRLVHESVEFGVCPICARSFSSKYAMTRHQNNVHANSHHICAKCDVKFLSKFTLTGHNLAVHNTSKIFACGQCPLCFLEPSDRQLHITEAHKCTFSFFPSPCLCLCPTCPRATSTVAFSSCVLA